MLCRRQLAPSVGERVLVDGGPTPMEIVGVAADAVYMRAKPTDARRVELFVSRT